MNKLSPIAHSVLRSLARAPMPTQDVNPGVVDRLMRGKPVEVIQLPSPFKTHKGASIAHLQITDAGRAEMSR